jgi:hypothetical protein
MKLVAGEINSFRGVIEELNEVSLCWVLVLDWSEHSLIHLKELIDRGLWSEGEDWRLVLQVSAVTALQGLTHTNVLEVVHLDI